VNAPIARLFMVVVVLFGVLIAFTSRWTVFEADALEDNAKNARPVLKTLQIRRGLVRAADGTLLARSVRGERGLFSRRYPQGELFAHAVGYSYADIGQNALEQERNDALIGQDGELATFVDELTGRRPVGKDVITHLDPQAQRVALQALGGRKGAVVALDPRTGAVKAMASTPAYDPGALRRRGVFSRLATDEANSPLVNRATQAGYPPGSTMKVVTAIAAIDSGRFTPSSVVDGQNGKPISGVPLNNFGNAEFGRVDLTTALTKSVNTAWASVAESLGPGTMQRYMERLGFFADPPIDLPEDDLNGSGPRAGGRLIDADDDRVDIGRLGIGQDRLLVTPLQMAMVAAAVANGGELMEPRITDDVVDRDGRKSDDVDPERLSRVMSEDSARQVRDMMAKVVEEGSGTAAALSGVRVAGKTGTAEVREQCPNQAWFIGFAPVDDPQVAVAATVECTSGTGGETAAPIARSVIQSLLR
jgi:penicillin-binding protein A